MPIPSRRLAGHQTQQIAGLQRGRQRQKPGQQVELAALRARPFGAGDQMQCVNDCGYLQAWLPIFGLRRQQLLGGLAEVASFPHRRDNLPRHDTSRCRNRTQCQLFGEPKVHRGKFRRHQPLTQITDGGQQLLGSPGQQHCQPVNQHQTTRSLFQVAVRLGYHLVLHSAIFARSMGVVRRSSVRSRR